MLQMLPASLEDQLISTQRQIDALLLEQSRLAARFAESEAWSGDGFISAIHWIRFNCHVTSAMAANYVCVGEEESRLARTVDSVEKGELGFAHLLVRARTARYTGKAFDEDRLLPLALESSPGKFYYQCLHYRHSVDAREYNQDQERLAEERRLSLSTAEDGCLLISGLLDPVSGRRGAQRPRAAEGPVRTNQPSWRVDFSANGRYSALYSLGRSIAMARIGEILREEGEQIEFLATAADTNGELIRCRVLLDPSRPAPPEHTHPNQEERFTVEHGRLGYVLGTKRLEAGPGEVAVVPRATNHTFWNAGSDELSVVIEVRPALRFEDWAETIHVLIRDGLLAAGGKKPNPLMLAVVAHAYRREWRLTKLSPVARALLPLLALVGRAAGYRSHYSPDGEAQKREASAAV